jgi:diguanylate cyclase (GGDEF)-like protein/PAS domain S-box-containing protein
MLQAAAACLVLAQFGWRAGDSRRFDLVVIGIVLLAALAMHLVNTGCVATIVGLQEGQSPAHVWWHGVINIDRAEFAAHLGQVGIGMLAVVIAEGDVWALLLLLLPIAGVYAALDQHVKIRRFVEDRLLGAEANLAEAQRIAHLGSWEWNLLDDTWTWSDEATRILGTGPDRVVATRADFLAAVHPDDRAIVDDAFDAALRERQPFSLDHSIVRPDGSERVVNVRVEAVVGASGSVERLIGTLHDITQRKQLEDRLVFQAYHDELTRLPNRRLFVDRLEHALRRTRRSEKHSAVFFLDLDRFKFINDTLGHEAGDNLLLQVAARIGMSVRAGSTIARFGGDEFTVLLEDVVDRAEVLAVAERVLVSLGEPYLLEGRPTHVTASIGIALCTDSYASPSDVLRDADVALYCAKDAGRAGYVVFEPGMGSATADRVGLEADLRLAMERGELSVVYEPEVEVATGRIVGVEALLRWSHPERGMVPPAVFIPIAEESGLIIPIGRWVLQRACRDARCWQDELRAPYPVSVNVSGRELLRSDFVQEISRVLRVTGLPPGSLRLEISESLIMSDADVAVETQRGLLELGVEIVVDDFGTGHASLRHLKRFRINTLKLDRSIVSGLGENPDATVIAQAVIGLAHGLGMKVIAEGVEQELQLRELETLGCEWAQGYYFTHPISSEQFAALVAASHEARPLESVAA